jgi:mannose-6-phosphate isomerase-like protein (cupin superfamily)
VKRVEFPWRLVPPEFHHTRAARGATFQVGIAELDGTIPGHVTPSKQVLVVLEGRVVCSTGDEELELGVGDAVEWQEGEWHETRSLEKSRLLMIEGEFE